LLQPGQAPHPWSQSYPGRYSTCKFNPSAPPPHAGAEAALALSRQCFKTLAARMGTDCQGGRNPHEEAGS